MRENMYLITPNLESALRRLKEKEVEVVLRIEAIF
jgi:hypothetical protein